MTPLGAVFRKGSNMTSLHTTVVSAVAFAALSACAQMPSGPAASGLGMSAAASEQRMAMMDMQTKSMRDMHEKMMRARSPEERGALQPEHMKMMRDSMSMMGGMGADGMKGMHGMHGMGAVPGDMATRQQMMEKHMEMMQSMMQMMMDQMPPAPGKP
jgi:hypothetical protein